MSPLLWASSRLRLRDVWKWECEVCLGVGGGDRCEYVRAGAVSGGSVGAGGGRAMSAQGCSGAPWDGANRGRGRGKSEDGRKEEGRSCLTNHTHPPGRLSKLFHTCLGSLALSWAFYFLRVHNRQQLLEPGWDAEPHPTSRPRPV
jgi:hypothetical protein